MLSLVHICTLNQQPQQLLVLGIGRLHRSHYYISHAGALRPYSAAVSATFSSRVFNLSAPILLFYNWLLMQSNVIDFLMAFCCPFLQLLQKTDCLLWAVGSFSKGRDLTNSNYTQQHSEDFRRIRGKKLRVLPV